MKGLVFVLMLAICSCAVRPVQGDGAQGPVVEQVKDGSRVALRVDSMLSSSLDADRQTGGFLSSTSTYGFPVEGNALGLALEVGDPYGVSYLFVFRRYQLDTFGGFLKDELDEFGMVARFYVGEEGPVVGIFQVGLLFLDEPEEAASGMIPGIEFGGGVAWHITEDLQADITARYIWLDSGDIALLSVDETSVDGTQIFLATSYWF